MFGFTGNNIEDIGAQSIGDGLKSLTSLTTLYLSCELCVMLITLLCWLLCWWSVVVYVCVLDVQGTRLETLEHNPLVMVLSHLYHLQDWIWDVSDVWLCVCVDCCVDWMCLCVGDVQTTRLETLEQNALVMVSSHLHHLQHCIWMVKDLCDVVMCAPHWLCVMCNWMHSCVGCCGCTDNKIGDIGAQSIGDGLKSLTLLTALYLNSEWCVMCDVVMCAPHWLWVMCNWVHSCVCVCVVDVQTTALGTLEHKALAIVSSHSHHLQHWIWIVSDEWCVMCHIDCVIWCVWCVLINWLWMYSEQHWRHWSTKHWWWSQVTHITHNTGFGWWVMCDVWCCDVCTTLIVWCVIECIHVCVCWDVQTTTLGTLEHKALAMVSSHSHHLQHWVWVVSVARVCTIDCVCVCWWNVLMVAFVCVGLYSQQHWRRWSTVHWWWSQIADITKIIGFKWWVMCVYFDHHWTWHHFFCMFLQGNKLTDGQKEVIKQTVVQTNPQCSVSMWPSCPKHGVVVCFVCCVLCCVVWKQSDQ